MSHVDVAMLTLTVTVSSAINVYQQPPQARQQQPQQPQHREQRQRQ